MRARHWARCRISSAAVLRSASIGCPWSTAPGAARASAMGLLRSAACRRSISGVTPFGSFSKISIDGLAATIAGGSRLAGAIDGGGAVGAGAVSQRVGGGESRGCARGVAFAGVLGGLAGRGAGRETICCACAEIDLGPDENGITVGAAAGIGGRGGAASGAAALRTAARRCCGDGGVVFAGGGAARAAGAAVRGAGCAGAAAGRAAPGLLELDAGRPLASGVRAGATGSGSGLGAGPRSGRMAANWASARCIFGVINLVAPCATDAACP